MCVCVREREREREKDVGVGVSSNMKSIIFDPHPLIPPSPSVSFLFFVFFLPFLCLSQSFFLTVSASFFSCLRFYHCLSLSFSLCTFTYFTSPLSFFRHLAYQHVSASVFLSPFSFYIILRLSFPLSLTPSLSYALILNVRVKFSLASALSRF